MTVPKLPLVEELDPTLDVMFAVRAVSHLPGLLLFESALRREPVGRFSFLMADPIKKWQRVSARGCQSASSYPADSLHPNERSVFGEDPFKDIRAEWEHLQADPIPGLPPFQGGIAGLLGYELGQAWERIPSAKCDEFEIPPMAVGLYDWVIAWDHAIRRVWLISQGWPELDSTKQQAQAGLRIRQVKRCLNSAATVRPHQHTIETPSQQELLFAEQFSLDGFARVTSTFTRDAYLKMVQRAIDYIYAGDIFQVNLSQRLLAPAPLSSVELFERLRKVNPAPFAGLMQWDDWAIISASPERFLCVTEGEVETRPIKGTRQRKRGPEADLFTQDELRQSEKDRAENVMIVDLLRNDLSRVCQPGTIRIPHLCSVETYETVQHLVSEVRGQLRKDQTVWDLFRATFPGGSISGAPKVRAMQIIAELEPTVRGPYCGSLFYVGMNGQTDSNLLIRSFVQRHGWLQCNVGGGIVAQSDPAAEYEETLTKAAGMLKALFAT